MLSAKARFYSIVALLTALLFSGIPSMAVAQPDETPDVSEFTVILKTSADGVQLTCKKGCAWKELKFSTVVGDGPQAVDQYGMTPLPRQRSTEQSDLSNFVMTIKRTQDGISLQGLEGTAWKTLTFGPVPERGQAIDQNGMTTFASR